MNRVYSLFYVSTYFWSVFLVSIFIFSWRAHVSECSYISLCFTIKRFVLLIVTWLSTFCHVYCYLNYQQTLFMLCKVRFNHLAKINWQFTDLFHPELLSCQFVFPLFYSKRWRTSRRSTWSAGSSSTAWRLSPLLTPTRKCLQAPQNPSRVRALKHKKTHKPDRNRLMG